METSPSQLWAGCVEMFVVGIGTRWRISELNNIGNWIMTTQISPTKSKESADSPSSPTAEPQPEPEQVATTLSLDLVFEVLKNERRRHVLRYLQENPGQTTLSDLAEHIAAIENDKPITALTSQERKRVYVGLYQCHLPKMNDTDVIDFDDNRGTVNVGPNAEQLYKFLDVESTEQSRWPYYYLGVSIIGGGLFAVSIVTAAVQLTIAFTATIIAVSTLAVVQTVADT